MWIRILFGILVSTLFLLLGFIHFQKSNLEKFNNNTIVRKAQDRVKLLRIESAPTKKNTGFRAEVKWLEPEKGYGIKGISYFKDSNNLPEKGSLIIVENELKLFQSPTNPGQFNFAQYANGNNWYYSVFIDKWEAVEWSISASLTDWFSGLREYLLGIVALYLDGDEYSICSALVFGDKASLSSEIKDAYSGAGAMHVLAVSGLHVGLVYLFLKFLLSFLDKTRKSRILKTLLIILLIFIYAGITGFSPSVTRASFMFSLIAFGVIMRRTSSIYNIIFVSAFVMLLYDPRLLFDVSFQLSYIAVLGIIFLYPRLFILWDPKTWVGYNIWSLICLSLAAQISTFALALYYFKLFPTWFLLTNIVVVPGAMIELGGGFFLVFSHFVGIGEWVGLVYSKIIWTINQAILFIDSLPPGPLKIGFNGFQLFTSYLLLGLSFFLLEFPKKRILRTVFLVMLFFVLSFIYEDINTQKQKGVLVYDSKNVMLEFYSGENAILYTDTLDKKFEKDFRYIINSSFASRNIKQIEIRPISLKKTHILSFKVDQKQFLIPLYKSFKVETYVGNDSNQLVIIPKNLFLKKRIDSIKSKENDYWQIRKQGCFYLNL